MVSAFAAANKVVLGQVKTDAKSNEITAIPALLDLLEIKGCLVTIDAMGYQRKIAEKIIEKRATTCWPSKATKANPKMRSNIIFPYTSCNTGAVKVIRELERTAVVQKHGSIS